MRFFWGFLLLPVFVLTETVDLSVTVSSGINLEFENFSLQSADFALQEDGSHLFTAEVPWYIASNGSSGNFKLQGRLSQPLDPGWSLEMILYPPEDKEGVFSSTTAVDKYISLKPEAQTFLTSIKQGRIGDLQRQKIRLFATHSGFIQKMNSNFQIIVEWTLIDE